MRICSLHSEEKMQKKKIARQGESILSWRWNWQVPKSQRIIPHGMGQIGPTFEENKQVG